MPWKVCGFTLDGEFQSVFPAELYQIFEISHVHVIGLGNKFPFLGIENMINFEAFGVSPIREAELLQPFWHLPSCLWDVGSDEIPQIPYYVIVRIPR